ncbi:epididymal secretory glutathione peroxidase-like [Ochotona curzoniae]|uniref:epididymal secretory glutathione peroxidase-like n=1 Tax=Ochotona curzoniae TaxID=130825 RepID=UPI001B34F40A|nr:epididymal secretory glutathione peroxidase-like [Ochotona curzoniae]XP_040852699.1 epididymal secretory glutathione peroxidase-like [Ochotona curzoniae]
MAAQLQAFCLVSLLLVGFVQTNPKPETMKMDCDKGVEGTIFDYEAFTLDGKEKIRFRQYAGKYVLFINVATYCALTDQYPGTSVQAEDLFQISSYLRKGM